MAHVQICVRNQGNRAMTSIEGVIFIALLSNDGQTIGRQQVSISHADADFPNLIPGNYHASVTHPNVLPQTAGYDFGIQATTEIIQVSFVYSEPERVLLRSFMELRMRWPTTRIKMLTRLLLQKSKRIELEFSAYLKNYGRVRVTPTESTS